MIKFQFILILFLFAGTASAQLAQKNEKETGSGSPKGPGEASVAEREQFFYDRLTSGEIKDINEIERLGYTGFVSMDNRLAMKAESTPTWQQLGTGLGGFSSGRIRSIAFDPVDSNTVYIGATVGGLWKTTDYTAHPAVWQPLADNLPTLVCGSIAIPHQEPKTIYLGTGEVAPGWTSPDGKGVYKSIDGGLNWTNVLPSSVMGPTCAQIAIDPQHPETLFVAAPTRLFDILNARDTVTTFGLFRTVDGGAHWTKLALPAGVAGVGVYPVSIVIDPVNTLNVTVSGFFGEILHSSDGGSTWITAAVPHVDSLMNPILAISASDPNILYASIGSVVEFGGYFYNYFTEGLYKSTNSGVDWTLINSGTSVQVPRGNGWLGQQSCYANAIAVDPASPNHVTIGGLIVCETFDGGVTINPISYEDDRVDIPSTSHPDIHVLTYHNGMLFDGGDGGLCTYDGTNWDLSLNAGIPTLEFVGVDADQGLNFVLAGAQDNGTMISPVSGSHWSMTRTWDGGTTWISPENPARAFATYVTTRIFRSDDTCKTWSDNGSWTSLVTNQSLLNESSPFYAAYDASPDGSIVAFGGYQHAYISLDGGDDGFARQGTPAINASYSMKVSPYNSNYMWAGTLSHIFRSTNQGLHWTISNMPVTGNVVGIAVGNNDSTVYGVIAGLTSDSNGHFVKSTNGGLNWIKAATNFPMTPVNSLARATSGQLFVGTDYGVITSTDDGVTWSPFGLGMPRVQVLSLKVKGNNDQYLLAGTHGRGAYWIPITSLDVEKNSAAQFTVGECHPNPVNAGSQQATQLTFTLDRSRPLEATLYDVLGHSVEVVANRSFAEGMHTIQIPTVGLPEGDYFVAIQTSGEALIRKISVVR